MDVVISAKTMLSHARQRVQREQHARRGQDFDPVWAHRRLLRAGDTLTPEVSTRLKTVLATDDRTGELGAA